MTTPRCLCECSLLHRCEIWTGRASTSLCCRRRRRTAPTRSSTMATRSWRQAELYRCAFVELSLELSWVENNPGDKIENHAKESFFEIGFCCWNLPMCLSQRQLEGHAFSFLPTTNWTYIQNKSAECRVSFHHFVKFLPRFHKRWWKQFEKTFSGENTRRPNLSDRKMSETRLDLKVMYLVRVLK